MSVIRAAPLTSVESTERRASDPAFNRGGFRVAAIFIHRNPIPAFAVTGAA